MSVRVTSEEELRDIVARAQSGGWMQLAIVLADREWHLKKLHKETWPEDRIVVCDNFNVRNWSVLSSLNGLTSLSLWNNEIEDEGARALSSLTSLTSLDIAENRIGDGGARMLSSLTALTSLNLASNQIRSIGARALSSLTALTWLDISGNQLGAHGVKALTSLTALTSLNLGHNHIGDEGARALSSLTALTSLNLGYNGVRTEGAHALSSLTSLTSLDIRNNQIGDEGARALSSLTALTTLNLWYNHIGDEGARALSSLTALTSLNLGNNEIGAGGARALSSLTALTSLNLWSDEIGDEGAHALSSLTALTSLNLGSNEIGDEGAHTLSSLTALTSLNLGSNEIGDEGARTLSSLTALTSLDLGNNRIGSEGAGALSSLTALTSLDLRHNRIGDKGVRALLSLVALTRLNLSDCGLTRFPVDLLKLSSLEYLSVQENNITDLPAELWQKGENCLPSVRAHFADLEKGAVDDHELKLILLGNGRVGKTSIVRFLMNEPFNETESSTHGIQLRVRNESIDGNAVRINIWDFGGQDIYFDTHALFLRSRAIFLIVWDKDTEDEESYVDEERQFRFEHRPLQYWIDYVRTLRPDPLVIVVQNKCDDGRGVEPKANLGDADRTGFSAKHPQVNEGVLTSMIRNAVRRALRQPAAFAIGLGRWRVKRQIRRWQDEDNRRRSDEPHEHRSLVLSEFIRLCEQIGDVSSPLALLEYLHDTGVVYYQPTLFHGDIIVDQAWAIDAVYAIFHRDKCYRQLRKNGGQFQRDDLAALIWDEQGFSESDQRLFLSFMESSSICFSVGQDHGEPVYLAPQLLPERDQLPANIRRRLDAQLTSVDRTSGFYYRYRHRFLHEGVMRRFMNGCAPLFGDNAVYWRNGMQICQSDTSERGPLSVSSVAEIVCRRQPERGPAEGEIVISVWGDGREETLGFLRKTFNDLHAGDHVEQGRSIDGCNWVRSDAAEIYRSVLEFVPKPGEELDERDREYAAGGSREQLFPWTLEMKADSQPTSPAIYISYAWSNPNETSTENRSDFIDRLYESLKASGFDVRRDKDNLAYKGDLNTFMQEIGRAVCVVAVISDKSLKSPYCMYELLEAHRNPNFKERVFPIVLCDAKIHSLADRLYYVAHWKDEYRKLEELVNKIGIDVISSGGGFQEYEKIREISRRADELLSILGNMNTLKPVDLEANSFERLKSSIVEWFEKLGVRPDQKFAEPSLDLALLRQRCDTGDEFEFLYFWGHTPAKDDVITPSCLSQFYEAQFTIDGVGYPTAEHWMMASKARMFSDVETLPFILESPDPKSAKALGRKVKNFDEQIWSAKRRGIVTEGNLAKFRQNSPLKEFLLSTGNKILVEASPRDRIWGIGMGVGNEKAKDPRTWNGQNLLGFALVDVRAMLRNESQ